MLRSERETARLNNKCIVIVRVTCAHTLLGSFEAEQNTRNDTEPKFELRLKFWHWKRKKNQRKEANDPVHVLCVQYGRFIYTRNAQQIRCSLLPEWNEWKSKFMQTNKIKVSWIIPFEKREKKNETAENGMRLGDEREINSFRRPRSSKSALPLTGNMRGVQCVTWQKSTQNRFQKRTAKIADNWINKEHTIAKTNMVFGARSRYCFGAGDGDGTALTSHVADTFCRYNTCRYLYVSKSKYSKSP